MISELCSGRWGGRDRETGEAEVEGRRREGVEGARREREKRELSKKQQKGGISRSHEGTMRKGRSGGGIQRRISARKLRRRVGGREFRRKRGQPYPQEASFLPNVSRGLLSAVRGKGKAAISTTLSGGAGSSGPPQTAQPGSQMFSVKVLLHLYGAEC